MILIDVTALSLSKTFDMEVDENMSAKELASTSAKLITSMEHIEYVENQSFLLFAYKQNGVLQEDLSLKEQGIVSGEHLYLF